MSRARLNLMTMLTFRTRDCAKVPPRQGGLLVACTLAASCAALDDAQPPPVEVVEQAITTGETSSWYGLPSHWLWSADGIDFAIAHFGRAAALMETTAFRCSATLITESTIVTAAHCDERAHVGSTQTFVFGRFAQFTFEGERLLPTAERDAYLKRRLAELGLTPPSDFESLATASCTFAENGDDGRDLQYWECEPYQLDGREVYPGEIWGWVPPGRPADDGDRLSVVGSNRLSERHEAFEVLHSNDGKITKSHDNPFRICNPPWRHCFHHSVDTRSGFSGSIIIARADLRAVGVNSGRVFADDRAGESFGPGPDIGVNTGAPFDEYVRETFPPLEASAVKPLVTDESTVGTSAGVPSDALETKLTVAECGNGWYIAGLVVLSDWWLHGIGVVCVPVVSDPIRRFQYARAELAGAADQIEGVSVGGYPYPYQFLRNAARLPRDDRSSRPGDAAEASQGRGVNEFICSDPLQRVVAIDVSVYSDGPVAGVSAIACSFHSERTPTPVYRDAVVELGHPLGLEGDEVQTIGCDAESVLTGIAVEVDEFMGVHTIAAVCNKWL